MHDVTSKTATETPNRDLKPRELQLKTPKQRLKSWNCDIFIIATKSSKTFSIKVFPNYSQLKNIFLQMYHNSLALQNRDLNLQKTDLTSKTVT